MILHSRSLIGIPLITFRIYEPQALIHGSDLVKENWFTGVCKLRIKDQSGNLIASGTGFLIQFTIDPQREVFGFLTCCHVIPLDAQSRPLDPAHVFLKSQAMGVHKLRDIQLAGTTPLFSQFSDFYFVQISPAFQSECPRGM